VLRGKIYQKQLTWFLEVRGAKNDIIKRHS
jgi:hypothetical protein